MKKWCIVVIAVLAGHSAAHALTVDGVEVTASVDVRDGVPAKQWRNETYDLPADLSDWVLFSGTSIAAPAEQKANADILSNFVAGVSSVLDANAGNRLEFAWSDGDPTASATQDVGVKSPADAGAFLTWDVHLPALSGVTTGYEMQYYTVDKRRTSSMQVFGDLAAYESLLSEGGNDENFLRLWTVTMDGYTGPKTLTFRYHIDAVTGSGEIMVFGGITVKALGGEPSVLSLNPSDQLDMTLTAPATTVTNTIEASFVYGGLSNNVVITGVTVDNPAITSLDTGLLPITLTDPSPSNETLSFEFDNAIAGLTDNGQTTSGVISVIWNEIGGASQTNELAVEATYLSAPIMLQFGPSDVLALTPISPVVSATQDVAVSYTEATLGSSNAQITAVAFSNESHAGVFTNLTSLPLTLPDPAPSNSTLTVGFDASTLSTGDTASADMVVSWIELGDTTTNQSVLPVTGTLFAPATGTIAEFATLPSTSHILLESVPPEVVAYEARRRPGDDNVITYQEIKGSDLSGVTTFDGLLLRARDNKSFVGVPGVHQLQIWFGKVFESDGFIASTIAVETFDCSERVFDVHKYYQFKLSAPVVFDPGSLGLDEAYGFEVWWTSADPANSLRFQRGNTSMVDGRSNSRSTSNDTFPVLMNNLISRDLYFALATGLFLVSDVSIEFDGSDILTCIEGEAGATYTLQRTLDLVSPSWSNIAEHITGEGVLCITNETDEVQSFYRAVLD